MTVDEHRLKLRRKPVQRRSQMTQGAILEAFVRLLVEKGYQRLTIRDIAALAGVGLGTVYEYFPGKKSIAAHCIHQRFKGVGLRMQACIQARQGQALRALVTGLLDEIVDLHRQQVQEWSALVALERQVSDASAFQALYRQIADIWGAAFLASSDVAAYAGKDPAVVHAAVYGLLYQRLLTAPQEVLAEQFRRQLQELVLGYLSMP